LLEARKIGNVFEDDRQRTNTQTLSNVIETIHIFVDRLSGIIDAWETFSSTEIMLFTRHAPDKLTWPEMLTSITRSISELERLRKLLITKRERFKFKLESVSIFLSYLPHEHFYMFPAVRSGGLAPKNQDTDIVEFHRLNFTPTLLYMSIFTNTTYRSNLSIFAFFYLNIILWH
jgi:hypothetical protein